MTKLMLITGMMALAMVQPNQQETTPSPAPTHAVWHYFNVEGKVLVDPTVRDSLGKWPWIKLPPGSVLSVPEEVPGEEPPPARAIS